MNVADGIPTGETDLAAMLRGLTATVRDGEYALVHVDGPIPPGAAIAAVIVEEEGTTVVVPSEVADDRGWSPAFVGRWVTLDVHSSLHAVGLTAVVAAALAERDIPCNVLAGAYHDHLLVPSDRVEDALGALARLRDG